MTTKDVAAALAPLVPAIGWVIDHYAASAQKAQAAAASQTAYSALLEVVARCCE